MSAPLAVLRDELRYQCSFKEIATLLNQYGPVARVNFPKSTRSDSVHTRFGGVEDSRPWYAPPSPTEHAGWEVMVRWLAQGDVWASRDWLLSLGMIHLDPAPKVDCHMIDNKRVVTQLGVLYAKDFPAMWLADRLRRS